MIRFGTNVLAETQFSGVLVLINLVSYGLFPASKILHLSNYPFIDSSILSGRNRLFELGDIES